MKSLQANQKLKKNYKEIVSIIIVTHNNIRHIEACIESVLSQDYPFEVEIIVVDNNSNDGTPELVRQKYPNIQVIQNKDNRGYGAGNNLGVRYARGEYIVILNPDTIVEKGWLEELINPLRTMDKLITTPKILVYDGSKINTCGNIIHFTGLAFTRGFGRDPNTFQEPEYVSEFSGCCFAIKRADFIKLGGFDESIFLYHDDVDLSYRAHLKGFKILYVPTSIVRHDYTLKVTPSKLYHLEKGRYIILRKYFSFKDLLVFLPSLIVAEILTFGFALKLGWKGIFYKFKAIVDGLTTKVCKIEGNKENLFRNLSMEIPIDQLTYNIIERKIKIFANKIFKLNFRIAKYFRIASD